jgi:hypothetical protein
MLRTNSWHRIVGKEVVARRNVPAFRRHPETEEFFKRFPYICDMSFPDWLLADLRLPEGMRGKPDQEHA